MHWIRNLKPKQWELNVNVEEVVRVNDLRTHFFIEEGIVKAVDGVSLRIHRGECLGLVGESGCGKSMTALSILRLIPEPPGKIVSGQIYFKGGDLMQLTEKGMREIRGKEISMIFQEPSASMNPSFCIGNQIREIIWFHQGGGKKAIAEKSIESLKTVQIPDVQRILLQYPHELSGGMIQRVMIAMAIACEPDLLICDEPTTALDISTQAQIIALLNNLREERGTSMLFITHDLGILSWICTSVAVMYAGNVIEYSDIRSILRNPLHPYTQALIESTPRLDTNNPNKLKVIPGQVPNLIHAPAGCKFNPRCQLAMESCREAPPPMREREEGHWVACFLS
ncbi:ABC transporter ATP-binding protein [Thermodesulfobacteriota bacterium]